MQSPNCVLEGSFTDQAQGCLKSLYATLPVEQATKLDLPLYSSHARTKARALCTACAQGLSLYSYAQILIT